LADVFDGNRNVGRIYLAGAFVLTDQGRAVLAALLEER